MRLNRSIFASLLAIPLSFFATSARATPVNGQANIAGNVSVSATSINFSPTFVTTPGAMETGDFTGLTGGTIMSLTGGPVTGNTNVMNFVRFTNGVATPITFDLTYIAPGVERKPAAAAAPWVPNVLRLARLLLSSNSAATR